MRPRQVLIFLLGVFALIGAGWLAFPSDGVKAGPVTRRFPSFSKMAAEAREKKVNVDSVLTAVEERFHMQGDTVGDPFKDTSGPSLNILIKLMSMVSIVMAGLTVMLH